MGKTADKVLGAGLILGVLGLGAYGVTKGFKGAAKETGRITSGSSYDTKGFKTPFLALLNKDLEKLGDVPKIPYKEVSVLNGKTCFINIFSGGLIDVDKSTTNPDPNAVWTFQYAAVDTKGQPSDQVITFNKDESVNITEYRDGKKHILLFKNNKLYLDNKEVNGTAVQKYRIFLRVAYKLGLQLTEATWKVSQAIKNGKPIPEGKFYKTIVKAYHGEVLSEPSIDAPLPWVKDIFPDEVLKQQKYNAPKRGKGHSFAETGPGRNYLATNGCHCRKG